MLRLVGLVDVSLLLAWPRRETTFAVLAQISGAPPTLYPKFHALQIGKALPGALLSCTWLLLWLLTLALALLSSLAEVPPLPLRRRRVGRLLLLSLLGVVKTTYVPLA